MGWASSVITMVGGGGPPNHNSVGAQTWSRLSRFAGSPVCGVDLATSQAGAAGPPQ